MGVDVSAEVRVGWGLGLGGRLTSLSPSSEVLLLGMRWLDEPSGELDMPPLLSAVGTLCFWWYKSIVNRCKARRGSSSSAEEYDGQVSCGMPTGGALDRTSASLCEDCDEGSTKLLSAEPEMYPYPPPVPVMRGARGLTQRRRRSRLPETLTCGTTNGAGSGPRA